MNNSSVQESYSITSSDTITIDSSAWLNSNMSTGGYTFTSGVGGTIATFTTSGAVNGHTIGGASSEYIWAGPKEFVDSFPSWIRIEAMCKEFPGLEIAFEKFKTTYYLVKDEYDNPKDKK